MLRKYYFILFLPLYLSCAKRTDINKQVVYSGNALVIKELYFQNEIAGSQEDKSHSYLHLKLKINEGNSFEFHLLRYKDVSFDLEKDQLSYKFEFPYEVVYESDRIKPAILHFKEDGKRFIMKRVPDYRENIFLP